MRQAEGISTEPWKARNKRQTQMKALYRWMFFLLNLPEDMQRVAYSVVQSK